MSVPHLSYERYQRQLLLAGFGEEGQQKLFNASVLVVGAGGLGCPALQYLAAAGIGTLGVVDDDAVALHNLHRQVLYTTDDVGKAKASVAARRLAQMNPEIAVLSYHLRLTNQSAYDLIAGYDYVLDATDNFATRYLINDACLLLKKPFVYGAISQFEGQVAVFNYGRNSASYRDLFPQPPLPGAVLNCAEAGVLGVLPGMIGILQATEVIKLITGIGKPLVNQLLTYNALTNESFVFGLSANTATAALVPKTTSDFLQTNYEWLCGLDASAVKEMAVDTFAAYLAKNEVAIIDVREPGEQPEVTEFAHRRIPLSALSQQTPAIKEHVVVLFCQSGRRSIEAAKQLAAAFGNTKKIYSLQGGILNWKKHGKENT